MFEIKNDLSSTVVEVDEEMKYNNIMSTTRLCHTCKDQFRTSKEVSSKLSNPLRKICQQCYDKCNEEISKKKTTNLAYDRMKEKLFLYLKNNNYDYIKSKKKEFIMKFMFDNKIKSTHY